MYFTQGGGSLFEGVAKFVLCRKTLALHAGVTWSPFFKIFVYTVTSVWQFLKEVLSTSNGNSLLPVLQQNDFIF